MTYETLAEGPETIDLSTFSESETKDELTGQHFWTRPEKKPAQSPHDQKIIDLGSIIVEGHESIHPTEVVQNLVWLKDTLAPLPTYYQQVLTRVYETRFESCRDRQLLQRLMVVVELDVHTAQMELHRPSEFANPGREKANQDLLMKCQELINEADDNLSLRMWVAGSLNVTHRLLIKIISPNNLQSLSVINGASPTASLVAGRKITRPVLLLNPEEYKLVYETLSGEATQAIAHFSPLKLGLPSEAITYPLVRKAGGWLISSKRNPDVVEHEVLHTIDPLIRFGYDNLLTEVFAYLPFVRTPRELELLLTDRAYFQSAWRHEQALTTKLAGLFYQKDELAKKIDNGGYQTFAEIGRQVANLAWEQVEEQGFIATMRQIGKTRELGRYLGK